MGNFHSNSGRFEPPGSRSVAAFVYEYDKLASELRAEMRKASESTEALKLLKPADIPLRPKFSVCAICASYVDISAYPWERTNDDLRARRGSAGDADTVHSDTTASSSGGRRTNHGIRLRACQHVFCGACLAGSIYRNLNVAFNPSAYGTLLAPAPVGLGGGAAFPMGCPTCTTKPTSELAEIDDATARLVLGAGNMDEWNQARFAWTQDIAYLLDERRRSMGFS